MSLGNIYFNDPNEGLKPMLTFSPPGPKGADGPVAVSADAGNAVTLGTDGKLYCSASMGTVTDHGALADLGADDHTQYLNSTRGVARYGPRGTTPVVITDWNAAKYNNVVYHGNGAANAPTAGTWFMGRCFSRNSSYKKQVVWQYSHSVYSRDTTYVRHMVNGTWSSWYREADWRHSDGTNGGYVYLQHGPSLVNRFAYGVAKINASETPDDTDEFRIYAYDTAGANPRVCLKVNNANSVVVMPYTIQLGYTTVTTVANDITTFTVTFPQAFLRDPNTILSLATGSIGSDVTGLGVTDTTTTGFTGHVTRKTATSTGIAWVAFAA